MSGLIAKIMMAVRALSGRVGRLIAMATVKQLKQATADEIIADTLAKLEELQRRQARALSLLRDLVAKTQGIKDIKTRIDEL